MGIAGRFFMRVVQDPTRHHLFTRGLGIHTVDNDPKYLILRELWGSRLCSCRIFSMNCRSFLDPHFFPAVMGLGYSTRGLTAQAPGSLYQGFPYYSPVYLSPKVPP